MNAQSNTITARPLPRTAAPRKPRAKGRPLADRLEWMAVVVLPLASLVAAVSLLSHAIR